MSKESQYLDFYVMKYQDVVIRNAYVYVKDYHVAEDICQETFIRFEQKMKRFQTKKSYDGFFVYRNDLHWIT